MLTHTLLLCYIRGITQYTRKKKGMKQVLTHRALQSQNSPEDKPHCLLCLMPLDCVVMVLWCGVVVNSSQVARLGLRLMPLPAQCMMQPTPRCPTKEGGGLQKGKSVDT